MKKNVCSCLSESIDSYTTPTTTRTTYFSSWANWSFLFFFIVGVLFLSFFSSNYSFFQSQQCPLSISAKNDQYTMQMDELEETLEKTSMENKTLIIAFINKAYIEGNDVGKNMFDLFLEGFWSGDGTRDLIKHLMIVAIDQTAYDRCLFRGLHCHRLVTVGVDFTGEKIYMSDEFIKMMWGRTLLLLRVLNKGYNFIFTDTDVIWLRNPFPILTTNMTQDLDIQFSTDNYKGSPSSTKSPINTGFYFVKSNNKTVSLFEKWYNSKVNSSGLKEQDVLQDMIFKGDLNGLGLKARFLDTRFFSGFCQDSPDIRDVVTVHANCCRYISAKISDLSQVLQQWTNYKFRPSNHTTPFKWSKHENCIRSWITGSG